MNIEYEYRLLTAEEAAEVKPKTVPGYQVCLKREGGGDTWHVAYLTPEDFVRVLPGPTTSESRPT